MVEWETGLGWLLAAILAAFAAPLAETQHARAFGTAPIARFMDGAANDSPGIAGRPLGAPRNALTNAGPPTALLPLFA